MLMIVHHFLCIFHHFLCIFHHFLCIFHHFSIYSIEDIKSRAADLGAKFILTDQARAERVVEAVKDLECVEEVFVIGEAEGCTPINELLQDDGKGVDT